MIYKYLPFICLCGVIFSQATGEAQNRYNAHQQSKAGSSFLDYGNVRCNYDYPVYCDNSNYCCPTNASICCGDETCCPNDHPFCSDGLCYATGSKCHWSLPSVIVSMVLMLIARQLIQQRSLA